MMKVAYCRQCRRYWYSNQYRTLTCKRCNADRMIILDTLLVDFLKMDVDERQAYLERCLCQYKE